MRVLVVEDDRSVRETLGIVLESYQIQADLLEHPDAVLQYLECTWPDLMLLDLRLETISGEELYQKIRERFGATPPTLVLSAVQRGEERIRNMPGVRYLSKPYSLDELIRLVRETKKEERGAA